MFQGVDSPEDLQSLASCLTGLHGESGRSIEALYGGSTKKIQKANPGASFAALFSTGFEGWSLCAMGTTWQAPARYTLHDPFHGMFPLTLLIGMRCVDSRLLDLHNMSTEARLARLALPMSQDSEGSRGSYGSTGRKGGRLHGAQSECT